MTIHDCQKSNRTGLKIKITFHQNNLNKTVFLFWRTDVNNLIDQPDSIRFKACFYRIRNYLLRLNHN